MRAQEYLQREMAEMSLRMEQQKLDQEENIQEVCMQRVVVRL